MSITHHHSNKHILDKIGQDTETSNPLWNGGEWPGSGGGVDGVRPVDTIANLRDLLPGSDRIVYLKGHTVDGCGAGVFHGITGAAPGTYVDDNGVIVVPTGGDGSACWKRVLKGFVTPEMFGSTLLPAIQKANDYLEANGGGNLLYSGAYSIDGEVVTDSANVHHILMDGASITQSILGRGGIQLRADNCSVTGNGTISSTAVKSVIAGTYEAEPARIRSSAVYVADGDNCEVSEIHAVGFVHGVVLRGETDNVNNSTGNRVHDIVVSDVDQGVLYQQQDNVSIYNIVGSNVYVSQTGNPAHVIYGSEGNASLYSNNGLIKNIVGRDAGTGADHLVQLKYCRKFSGGQFMADTFRGIYLQTNTQDCVFDVLVGTNMQAIAGVAYVHLSGVDDSGNKITNITVDNSSANQVIVNVLNASGINSDNLISGVRINDNSSGSGNVVNLRGTRNKIRNVDLGCVGTARKLAVISSATNCSINGVTGYNIAGSNMVDIQASATGTVVKYDTSEFSLASGVIFSDAGSGSVITNNNDSEVFVANSGDTTPTVQNGRLLKTNNAAPTTISALDNGYRGQTVVVMFGDANTTVDFTGTTLLGNGGADYSAGLNDMMTCTYNGSNWLCDVVNT